MESAEGRVAAGQAMEGLGESGVRQPLELISRDQPWGGVAASSYQEWIESMQQQYQTMGKAVPNWTQQVSKGGSVKHRRSVYSPYHTGKQSEAITQVELGLKSIINRYAAKAQATETKIFKETTAPNRKRLFYTQSQVKQLETVFTITRYPNVEQKLQLAEALNMSVKQVSIWFQNRRCKDKRKDGQPNQAEPSSPEITNWQENYTVVTSDTEPMAMQENPVDLTLAPVSQAGEENVAAPTQIQQTVGMMENMVL